MAAGGEHPELVDSVDPKEFIVSYVRFFGYGEFR